jgi:hypothetical protein
VRFSFQMLLSAVQRIPEARDSAQTTITGPLLEPALPCLARPGLTDFRPKAKDEPVGLARPYPCLPHSRPARFHRGLVLKGRRIKRARCISAPRLVGSAHFDRACRQPIPSRPARLQSHRTKGQCRCRHKADESPLFGFFSLQRIPTEPAIFPKGGQPSDHPASAFASLLRFWRHSSSHTADVIRVCDRGSGHRSCVTGLFLGGVPLSAPHGFGLVNHSRASVNEAE